MPFKDIDYKKLNQSRELEKQLKNRIAVINKFIDPNLKPEEKLATAELITGRTLQPKPDPIRELLKEKEIAERAAPIVQKLEALEAPIKSVAAISHTPPSVFTEEDLEYYQRQGFPSFDEVRQADQGTIQEGLRKLTALNKELGNQKRTITKRLKKQAATNFDLKRYDELKKQRERNDKYRAEVKAINKKSGRGLSIGQYIIPKKRLKRDNILSVRYAKNPKKIVPAFGATRVSDNVKKTILGKGSHYLTAGEKKFLDKLYSKSQAKAIRGSGVYTSIQEIMERVEVLLGQIEAGNTSITLKNELADLLHYLFKHRKIKKSDYTNLIGRII